MKRLVFFTNAFPYSSSEPWKLNELEILSRYFERVTIAPYVALERPRLLLPSNVQVLPPAFDGHQRPVSKWELLSLLGPRLPTHLHTLVKEPCRHNFINLRKGLVSHLLIERILRSALFQDTLLPEMQGASLYFFWGTGYAGILPYMPAEIARMATVRFHGYDLYRERANGFIPHQRAIVEHAGMILTVSRHGANYLSELYPSQKEKIKQSPLGTEIRQAGRPSSDGKFRVLSCGYVRQEKRTSMIVEALGLLDGPVEWTHFGDGPLFDELKKEASSLRGHINLNLPGSVHNSQLLTYYETNPVDVFVNVSASEGLPVSIMEAMCAGIPVIATDVGGTRELVDDDVGRLLPPDVSAAELARALNDFRSREITARNRMREACRTRIINHYDRSGNAIQLVEHLKELRRLGV
jgi:glycosyltransferase involved in cell wall biosynthesis